MSRLLPVVLAVACALVRPPVVRAGLETFITISGQKVQIRDHSNPAKRQASFLSHDAALTFTGFNAPTQSGFYVRFQGACSGSSVFYLPTTRWSEKKGRFKYKDADGVDGPVRLVLAKSGSVKVRAKGAQLDLPLIGNGPQQQMTVIVETQETSWTAFFGPDNATIKKDDAAKGRFVALNASAAQPTASSCLGAFVR